MKFPIGIQLFSVRDNCSRDLPGTLKAIKEMGYDGVEPYTLYNYTPEEFKALLDEIGLVAMSSHVAVGEFEDPNNGGYDAVAEKYYKIGLKYIAVPYIAGERYPGQKDYGETLVSFRNMAAALAKYGITLTYHNHTFEMTEADNGAIRLDTLYGSLPADMLQCELDLAWLVDGGGDPIKYIRRYAGRLPHVHFKEVAYADAVPAKVCRALGLPVESEDQGSGYVFKPIGEGILPTKQILEELEKAGTKQIIVEQDNPTEGRDIMDCIAESVKYLRSLMD